MLLVGHGIAAGTGQGEIGLQGRHVSDRLGGHGVKRQLVEQAARNGRIEKSEQGFAGSRAMKRGPPADFDADTETLT